MIRHQFVYEFSTGTSRREFPVFLFFILLFALMNKSFVYSMSSVKRRSKQPTYETQVKDQNRMDKNAP